MAIKRLMIALAILLIILMVWTIWGNTALELNKHAIKSYKLPSEFDGFMIAQISDLHNAEIGDDNEKLLALLKEADPDIIAITGDMIDSRRVDIQVALDFAREAIKIAPCYYVNGNHELRVLEYEELKEGLKEIGVIILENEKATISKEDESLTIIGLSDPSLESGYIYTEEGEILNLYLSKLSKKDDNYKILLSHRPEYFDLYCEAGIDIVLSGHAHGGQIRLPFVGGIIAPHQGFFPKYDGGLYEKDETNMIVSRGIGNSLVPVRFNNRPEVVLIELQAR